MTEPPTRLGVLADPYLTETQVRSLAHAVETAGVEVPLVVVNAATDSRYDPDRKAAAVDGGLGLGTARLFLDVLRRERAWALVVAEKRLAELAGAETGSREIPVDEAAPLAGATVHRAASITDGAWAELPPETVDLVRDSCDVVVRYGFRLVRGAILDAPDHGVVSFRPADIRRYRGLGPPQAYLDGRRTMGVTLQRLTPEIDGGAVVAYAETDVSDCRTLWAAYDRPDELQVELLATGVETLRDPSTTVSTPDSLGEYNSTTLRRRPSFAARVLLKNVAGRLGL